MSKKSAELLTSMIQEKHLNTSERNSFYCNGGAKLRKYFHSDGHLFNFVDVQGLLAMGLPAYR